jgi:hypothetical protein
MKRRLAGFAFSFALLIAADAVVAQTPTPASPQSAAPSNRELRKQDREECTKQAVQQNTAKRNQAEFIRKCMADRQGERRAAAKKKASEKREKAAQDWVAYVGERGQQQRDLREQQAARWADCNRQADAQGFRKAERKRYITKCVVQ